MPKNINNVLSNNLKKLVSDKPSISACCREMGMNRTQFNRYRNGESWPRPDVLKRIVDYFGVDANMLLYEIDVPRDFDREPFGSGFEQGVRAAAAVAGGYCHARFKNAEKTGGEAVFASHTEHDIQNAILRKLLPGK